MKLSLFFFALLGVLPLASADLTVVQSIETSGTTNRVTIKIKGERARIDVNPESSMIVDTKTGEVVSLMPKQKAVLRLSAEKAQELGNKARVLLKDTDNSLEIATPKPTGKKEKINGYEAEEYVAQTQKYRAAYWVAKTYPDYQVILRQMKLLQNGAFAAVRKPMPDYFDFPGLPIRTKITLEGQPEATTTIVSVSQAPIVDSEFTVPADYAEMHLPKFELREAVPPTAPASPEKPDGQ
jgi:Domain of unknown function (DUF4412)